MRMKVNEREIKIAAVSRITAGYKQIMVTPANALLKKY